MARKKPPNRLLTDALREIRKTASRFVSLLVLSALAVCFLAGLRATAPDMKRTGDLYFDQQQLMDVRVLSTLGITDEDVAVLAQQPGVTAAEGAYTADGIIRLTQRDWIVKLLSYTQAPGLNAPRLVEGRMPQRGDECLAEPAFLKESGLAIGDVITLDTGSGTFEDALLYQTFSIVGAANSPLYISVERGSSSLGTGKVAAFLLLPQSAFAMDAYTDAYLRLDGVSQLMCYSEEYTDRIDAFQDQLEPLADQRAALRGAQVLRDANDEVGTAQGKLDDAQKEADQELADAQKELDDARRKLDDGWAEYQDGKDTLVREVRKGNQTLADGQRELDDALAELEDGELSLADARKELDDGWADYASGRTEYQDGLTEYRQGEADYQDGVQQYEDGLQRYKDGEKKIKDGWAEYRAGLSEYWSGSDQLSAAADQLNAGERDFAAGKAAFDGLTETIRTALVSPITGTPMFDTSAAMLAALHSQDPAVSAPAAAAIDQVLAGMCGQLDAGIGQTQAAIDGLQAQLDGVNGALAALPPAIAELDSGIAALETAIAQAESAGQDTAELRAQLAGLQSQLDGAHQQLAQAQAAKPQLEAGLDTAKGTLAQLQGQRAAIPADSAALLAAEQTILASRRQLDNGWSDYRSGSSQLDWASTQLDDARRELEKGERELADSKPELEDAQQSLKDAQLELEDAWVTLEDGRVTLEDALKKLQDGEQEYTDGQKDVADGWTEYNDGVAELADGRLTLKRETADAQRKLGDARIELQDGEAEYADGQADYLTGRAEAEEKLADARKKLEQARRDIAEIEESTWYVLGRNTNSGYVSYSMDADRMGNLASVFPLIFFLVAALVCLTTMTRMVEEQRVTIGGMKALGYSKGSIAVKYVGYGLLASAAGAVLGLAVGLTLIPWIICTAWTALYTLGPVQYGFYPLTSLLACLAAVGTVTLSALAACFSTLAAVPAQLMRPKPPPAGKRVLLERIPLLWRRLSFNYKITIRNLFRYQRRFWMTVIGIGGCAALIVTAFGLRDSIFDVLDQQYDQIYRYSAQVGLVDKVTPGELSEVERMLERSGGVEDFLPCRSELVTAETEQYTVNATLEVVPDQSALSRFVNLRHRTNDRPVVLPDDGVVLNEKLAALLGVSPGDTFILDGDTRTEVRVADVTEHYIQHYVYMTDAYYQTLYGKAPARNLILMDYPAGTAESETLDTQLIALDGVTTVSHILDTRRTFNVSLESVNYAVVLIIVCAAALAFVVLYNLTNINITERLRELATLKVLGFYDGELSAYIYRENVILTAFGVAMGMLMGRFLHQWLILTVEIDMLMFGRQLKGTSYLFAVVLTIIFSLLVNLAAHRKLKKLDMVESLKTVE